MSDYVNGIGSGDDLKLIEMDESSPVVYPGYVYFENSEYYIFASMRIVLLDSLSVAAPDYRPGTPYFIVDHPYMVTTEDDFSYIDTSTVYGWPDDSGWDLTDGVFVFQHTTLSGKYLVYDAGDTISSSLIITEPSTLVMTHELDRDPFKIDLTPIFYSAGSEGSKVTYKIHVTDDQGSVISGTHIYLYKVYTDENDVSHDEVISSLMTDSTGSTVGQVMVNQGEYDIFVYAKNGTLRSNVCWLQIHIPISGLAAGFQIENTAQVWASQEAMTAVGMNSWGDIWDENISDEYLSVVTGVLSLPTRLDWNEEYNYLRRPPFMFNSLLPSGSLAETEGIFSGYDFVEKYPSVAPSGVWEYMKDQYVAPQGYWGQVILNGNDILANWAALNAHCLNPVDSRYTIYHINSGGTIETLACEDHVGCFGSWNDVYEGRVYSIFEDDFGVPDGNHGALLGDYQLSSLPTSIDDMISVGAYAGDYWCIVSSTTGTDYNEVVVDITTGNLQFFHEDPVDVDATHSLKALYLNRAVYREIDFSGIYFVLYIPGYDGHDWNYALTHDFYFRGMAVINTNEESVDYLSQNYTIDDLITMGATIINS